MYNAKLTRFPYKTEIQFNEAGDCKRSNLKLERLQSQQKFGKEWEFY